jgi:N-acyl-D-amino-acid deacylase
VTDRRTFLAAAVAATLPALLRAEPPAGFKPFDDLMDGFLADNDIPGGSLAVSRNGRLVHARGYGLADRAGKRPVTADTRFRIASISKPVTAAAVLRLVDRGNFRLDDRLVDVLPVHPHVPAGGKPDARLKDVTVRHLLLHTAGWDRDKSGDPMFRPAAVAKAVGVEAPAGPLAVTRHALGLPLDFDPGTKFAYSNVGYCILGRLVEHHAGQPYEQYVREHVLAPLGITGMYCGRSLPRDRPAAESRYHEPDAGEKRSVVGPAGKVPWPDGGFYLEAMDAHGGWVSSAAELVRFADAFNDAEKCPILKPDSVRALFAPPEGAGKRYYGCGWSVVRVDGGRANAFHTGSLPGTSTLLVRRHDGLNWAVLFNTRNGGGDKEPSTKIDGPLHRAADAVKRWPEGDLYPGVLGGGAG